MMIKLGVNMPLKALMDNDVLTKVSVDIPGKIMTDLDILAKDMESSRAGIIRLALRDFISKNSKKKDD